MLMFVNNMDEAKTPEIWETEEEKELSVGQLKHHYLQLAKHNFLRKGLYQQKHAEADTGI